MQLSAWIVGPLSLLGFVVAFGGLWFVIVASLSLAGGWPRLAQRFAAVGPVAGERFGAVNGSMGTGVEYSHAWTVIVAEGGVYIAVWRFLAFRSPPLFLPWEEIASIGELTTRKSRHRLVALKLRGDGQLIGIGGKAGDRVREAHARFTARRTGFGPAPGTFGAR